MTSSTKTKTTPMTEVEKAEAKRDELIAAKALVDQRKAAADEATQRWEEIDAAFEAGDDLTYSLTEYTEAEAASTIADKLVAAAEKSVELLARQQVNLDVSAAEALAPIFENALRGRVPVIARIGKKPDDLAAEAVPSIVLTQQEPSRESGGIISSGKVIATYVRDDLMAPLPARGVKDSARELGMDIDTTQLALGNGTSGDGVTYDEYSVDVYRAWGPTFRLASQPTVAHAEEWALATARTFANEVNHASSREVMRMDNDPLRIAAARNVTADVTTVVTGTKAVTSAVARFDVAPGDQARGESFAERWGSLPATFVGQAVAHLGTCTAFVIESRQNLSRDTGWSPSDRFRFSVKATFTAEIAS